MKTMRLTQTLTGRARGRAMLMAGLGLALAAAGLLAGAAQAATFTWNGTGNASAQANWIEDGSAATRVPASGDDIVLNATSTGAMTWDAGVNGLPDTVASWTQTADYTGTVTIKTTYPEYTTGDGALGFTNLTIAGNATVSGGTWTHVNGNSANASPWLPYYRLRVHVGGNFSLGAGAAVATVTANGRGYQADRGPGAPMAGTQTGGAYGGTATSGAGGTTKQPYGSIVEPVDLGSGGDNHVGGGAIYITVGGATTLGANGVLTANGNPSDGPVTQGTGSGGSILLRTGSLSGAGVIRADGGSTGSWGMGGGGRIALILTGANQDFAAFSGSVTAYGGTNPPYNSQSGSPGTIYRQTGNQYAAATVGELVVRGNPPYSVATPMPDGVVLHNFAMVTITNNGFLSIGAANALDFGALILNGSGAASATLLIRDDTQVTYLTDQTVAGYTLRLPASPTTLTNLEIAGNGRVTGNAGTLSLALTGNLTIRDGGSILMTGRGFGKAAGPGAPAQADDNRAGAYGGRGRNSGPCYGSILAPMLRGSGNNAKGQPWENARAGGGAVILNVGGTTLIETGGTIAANGADGTGTTGAGSGGSVYLETDSLSGGGTIAANGGGSSGAYIYSSAGGGRLAVLLKGATSDFGGFTGALRAGAKS